MRTTPSHGAERQNGRDGDAAAHQAQARRGGRRPGSAGCLVVAGTSSVPAHARRTCSGAAGRVVQPGGSSSGWSSAAQDPPPVRPEQERDELPASSGSGAFAGIVNP